MRIRLIKPFRQGMRILNAGVILDGPEGFCARMIREGCAVPADVPTAENGPAEGQRKGRGRRDR